MDFDPRAHELFVAALDVDPSSRSEFLGKFCGSDHALRAAVQGLLDVATAPDPCLYTGGALEAPTSWAKLRPRQKLGPFRVLREIGSGGMGFVYLAVRDDGQYEQTVAIKTIQAVHNPVAIDRFLQERQILATLEHPNIARLVDGGVTGEGLPYLAMEYVDGLRVDRYCDEHRLALRDRLQLIRQVCLAVAHAHRNLVVHRDLKPGNILVAADGTVKLLDFGIAKFLAASERALDRDLTAMANRVLTPQYASPEQFLGRPVTASSDIYQLGLLAYELLAGIPPYSVQGLTPSEAQELICERPTRGPRSRLKDALSREALDHLASLRSTHRRLEHLITTDLESILLKALRKEPSDRYSSVEALVADLDRYLENRPVTARPVTTAYRVRKLIARNRLLTTSTASFVLLIAGLVAAYTWRLAAERDLARQERRVAVAARAESDQVVGFVVSLFEVSDPTLADSGPSISARELLDRGALRIDQELADQPLVRARMLDTIGVVYRHLSELESADRFIGQGLELRRQLLGEQDPAYAESLAHLARVRRGQSRFAESEALFREALAIVDGVDGQEAQVAEALQGLGGVLKDVDRFEEAEALYRRSIGLLGTRDSTELASLLLGLARLRDKGGDPDEAETLARRALDMNRRLLGNENVRVASVLRFLGGLSIDGGRLDDAEAQLLEAVGIRERVLGKDHTSVASARTTLADLYAAKGQPELAVQHYSGALEILERERGPDHPSLVQCLHNLAIVHWELGRVDEAATLLERVLAIELATYGSEHSNVAVTMSNLAEAETTRGRWEVAEELFLKALAIKRERVPGSPSLSYTLLALANLLRDEKRYDAAEPLYLEAIAIREAKWAADHPELTEARGEYAALLRATGREEEARSLPNPATAEAGSPSQGGRGAETGSS